MLKVFLAEDEFIIREGIKNNIDWQAHGYEFCGEASDGELAFPLIQKTRPDILITDIKMPFVDGLALSRLVKKELPETEIIILSGYEEFDYAKEAIQIGVARYLLKPINGETLLQEIDSVAEIILDKQKEKEIREKYQKEMEENSLRDQMDLFQHLVTGDCSMEELLSVADKLDLKIMAPWYSIVLLKIQSMKHDYEEYSGSIVVVDEKSAMDYIVRIMEKALVLREKKASSRYEDVVSEVIHYIEDNYAQEELSLNLLASHVNFSPNHLSMIFSQQTGQTLIRYLTDYRMNRAKELLRCSSKKSSVISMEVGYKDPHYFSYLFKKTQGMTPTQYRGGRAAEGEDL